MISNESTDQGARAAEGTSGTAVDDRQLVRDAKAGDLAAFEELTRRYQGKIYGLLYNMTSNKEDAEDLTQEVFVKAFQSLKHFKGKSSFYTWIYRIAINKAINFLKKRKRRAGISLDDVDSGIERDRAYVEYVSSNSTRRDVSVHELQEKLNKALMTLSDNHRTVVVLHDVQGVPHEEIARMTGCSCGTVRSRLFYARQQLQVELKDYIG
ncbi:MAG: sigma-70 family RNA polymerase sigma factor [Spartobacteria bacterium]|nr:sigma-70 family RNA polymerase sigma factor [Spartobacteria bacterium]